MYTESLKHLALPIILLTLRSSSVFFPLLLSHVLTLDKFHSYSFHEGSQMRSLADRDLCLSYQLVGCSPHTPEH